MLLPSRIYIARGYWHFGDFYIFLPNMGKDYETLTILSMGSLLVLSQIMVNPPWLLNYVHKKVRWQPEIKVLA